MKGLVIGFGNMGLTHCERYAAMGVEVAVVDIDPAGRENARARGLRVYGSLDEMTPDSVGFFDICSPTHLHYAQIRAVGLHGKPIFVEKPLVRTPEELAALRRDPPNAPLFVGEVEHYNPSLASFLSYSGQPYSVQVRREVDLDFFTLGTTPWFLNETLSGGIVLDLMIHDLNLLVSKFGRPRVCAVTGRRVRHPCVDEVHAQLAFPDFGATVFSTWAATPGSSPVRATLRIEDADGWHEARCDDYAIRERPLDQDPFHRELKAFLKMVDGTREAMNLHAYLEAMEVAFEIRARLSARTPTG